MEAQVGQLQAQLAQTQAELQYAIEQIRILNNTSEQQRISGYGHSTEYDRSASRHHNRFPLSIAQSELPVRQGYHSEHLRRQTENRLQGMDQWAENSALYLSTQCVDACEILLEWLVMEKEHVMEAAIRAKCEEEDWEYDSISTFSRVTFVYLSMRTTGTARKIATSGKRGDGLNAWRRLFQEYNPQLVTGAQALLRRALSMGRAKSVADVSDRIQELEELVR